MTKVSSAQISNNSTSYALDIKPVAVNNTEIRIANDNEKNELHTQLTEKLASLRSAATDAFTQFESSRDYLYRTLVKIVLVYREFEQDPEFLHQTYRDNGINHVESNDRLPNFRPFLRIVYGHKGSPTPAVSNKLGNFNRVLRSLYDIINSYPNEYRSNPEGKLSQHIKTMNGISRVLNGSDDADDFDPDPTTPTPAMARQQQAAIISIPELAERRIKMMETVPPTTIGTVAGCKYLQADKNGLVALIAKRNEDGSFNLIGSTATSAAINTLAVQGIKNNYSAVSPNLRVIAEVISITNYPEVGMPTNLAKRHIWADKYLWDSKKQSGVTTVVKPQMLVCGQTSSIINTSPGITSSAIVKCIPTVPLYTVANTLMVPVELTNDIRDSLYRGDFELMSAQPAIGLAKGSARNKTLKLEVVHPGETGSRTHVFHPAAKAADADCNDDIKPIWTTTVSHNLFWNMRRTLWDKWFATLGKNTQLGRLNNSVLGIKISADGLTIDFNQNVENKGPNRHYAMPVKFCDDVASSRLDIASKQIAPIFYNIADTAVLGNITLAGYASVIVIGFKTALGQYKVVVPAINLAGEGA